MNSRNDLRLLHRCLGLIVGIALTCFASPTVRAAVFDVSVVADYEFAILTTTGLNPGDSMTPFIPFQAKGVLSFTLDDTALGTKATTVAFTDVTGILDGTAPQDFLPHKIGPYEFVGGNLTNVVWNGDEIVSATVDDLAMKWEMIAPFGPNGADIRLFTKAGLPFQGQLDGIPMPNGTVLAGAAPFEVYMDQGNGNSVLAVIGQNRILTVVPEPGTLTLFGLATMSLAACSVWRRRRSK